MPESMHLPSVISIIVLATFFVCHPVVGQSTAAPYDDAVVAKVYQSECARCHGKDGQGTAAVAPLRFHTSIQELTTRIADTMPEDDPDACVGEEAKQLAQYIREHFSTKSPTESLTIGRMTVEQYRNAVADVIGRFPTATLPATVGEEEYDLLELAPTKPDTPGLRAEYYQSRGDSKANRLAYYRTDTRLEFDFENNGPAATISADQFAIIWTGGLVADHSGFYEFRLKTKNGARLYLNSDATRRSRNLRDARKSAGQQELIDAWVATGGEQEKTARVYLLGGRTYPIRMEFFKFFEDDASISLQWKPPHGTWAVLDYNHTTSARKPRVFALTTRFPADDQSLGYARGNSVSQQWRDATMNGAIEAATEVLERLPFLAALPAGIGEELRQRDLKEQTDLEIEAERAERVKRVRQFLLEFVSVAYRRPLTTAEQEMVLQIIQENENNLDSGVRRVVVMALMSPYFLYPDLTPATEKPSPHAVAARLSFGLWDSIPDAELTQAASAGELTSVKQIESHARRMLGDPRAKAKMRRFFDQWLELEYRDVAKDKQLFPEFDEAVTADLRRSLELFIDRVVWSRKSDYRQLLQANYLMLNKRLTDLYASQAIKSDKKSRDKRVITRIASRRQFASEFQPVDFPQEQRSGILTHPYLLSAFAYHNNTSPIHRGVFLTRNIVGRSLSPPPDAVAFNDEQFSPDLTMREKITELTRDTACMSCHSVINPLGFTLENFDAIGRWRVTDNQKPVDTTSEYTSADGEKLKLSSAGDVAAVAVTSESAQRSFIAHVFQHIVKRSPRDIDAELLGRLQTRFVDDKFNVRKLWARIATVAATRNLLDTSSLDTESSP